MEEDLRKREEREDMQQREVTVGGDKIPAHTAEG